MDKLRKVLTGKDDEDEERGNIITQGEETTLIRVLDDNSLGWGTRVKAFAICFVIGCASCILSSLFLFLPKGLTLFSIFYTIGNIMAISSTFFLMGPMNQLQKMFSSTRIIATVVMISALVMTLVAAFALKKTMLALVMVVIQFCAMTWYALSYIPYARDTVRTCFGSCVKV